LKNRINKRGARKMEKIDKGKKAFLFKQKEEIKND
jgi:hypothetical protein